MSPRIRKLVGTIVLLLTLIIYCFVVMVLAATVLPRLGSVAPPFFYMLAGILWIFPAGLLIRWMHRG